jgi:uncharacterized protein (TIGR02147 family)
MKPLFEFLDYRDYLNAFYEYHKSNTQGFSYRSFLQKAQISSPSFLKQVIDHKRKLTSNTVEKFILPLSLNRAESEFFRILVTYTHAIYNDEKQSLYREMRAIARSQDTKMIGEECYTFYEHWYTSALRELLVMNDFQDDWKKIASSLRPKITTKQAQSATKTLIKLGFLQQLDDGSYEQTNSTIHSGHEVNSHAIRSFNSQCLKLAQEALEELPKEERHITGITMGVSESAYEQITHEIEQLQSKILNILKDDENQTKVVQFNTTLFPMNQINLVDKGK